jgi:hypothetical protein
VHPNCPSQVGKLKLQFHLSSSTDQRSVSQFAARVGGLFTQVCASVPSTPLNLLAIHHSTALFVSLSVYQHPVRQACEHNRSELFPSLLSDVMTCDPQSLLSVISSHHLRRWPMLHAPCSNLRAPCSMLARLSRCFPSLSPVRAGAFRGTIT